MNFQQEIEEALEEVLLYSAKHSLRACFAIGNTAKDEDGLNYYITPIRIGTNFVSASVIVFSVEYAIKVAKIVDGKVDIIFVDGEKKVSKKSYGIDDVGNIERAVRETVNHSQIVVFKGNDITVSAIINFVLKYYESDQKEFIGGKQACCLGLGNIGFKVAIALVELGMWTFCSRRDEQALNVLVDAINRIKPQNTLASANTLLSEKFVPEEVDIWLTFTSEPVITPEIASRIKKSALVIDVGKGGVSKTAHKILASNGIIVYRISIVNAFNYHIFSYLDLPPIPHPSRLRVSDVSVVAAGVLAMNNEIILDSLPSPSKVIGIARGDGDLVRNLGPEQKDIIKKIEAHFSINRE